jgi:uncharacterized protein (TIGR02246 family)
LAKGVSSAPGSQRSLPRQPTSSKTPRHPGKNNEDSRSNDCSRIGNQLYFADLCSREEDVKPFPFTPIPAGPQLVQQIDAINQKFDEAFNKHDAAAVGALYTSNAVQTTPQGSFSGREAIEGYITDLFQRHNPSDRVTKMSYVYAFGGDLCALGGWTVTIDGSRKFGGYLAIVYTFVGGTWKIRASVFKYPTS